jgi:DNA-binding protein H-NS
MLKEIRELDAQIAKLQAQRDALFASAKAQALIKARALVAQYGMTAAQVGLSSISRAPAPRKSHRPTTFYDPNRGLSWDGTLSGKGRKPDWIRAAILDGTIESFRVMVQVRVHQPAATEPTPATVDPEPLFPVN